MYQCLKRLPHGVNCGGFKCIYVMSRGVVFVSASRPVNVLVHAPYSLHAPLLFPPLLSLGSWVRCYFSVCLLFLCLPLVSFAVVAIARLLRARTSSLGGRRVAFLGGL